MPTKHICVVALKKFECQRMSAGTQIIFRIFFKIIGNEIECQRMSAGTQIGTHAPLGR